MAFPGEPLEEDALTLLEELLAGEPELAPRVEPEEPAAVLPSEPPELVAAMPLEALAVVAAEVADELVAVALAVPVLVAAMVPAPPVAEDELTGCAVQPAESSAAATQAQQEDRVAERMPCTIRSRAR